MTYRVHADISSGKRPLAACGLRSARAWTQDDYDITCETCLWWLGLYVPLSKLREHQALQRDAGGGLRNQLAQLKYDRAFK